MEFRIESDTLGEVNVPVSAYYGAQTARAIENFPISGFRLPPEFVRAQAVIKLAAARANRDAGALSPEIAGAIETAAQEVLDGKHETEFVVDVFQAGAGTSQNMNINEVVANRANELLGGKLGEYEFVHPNDHVNYGQSTNDTIPSAIRIAAVAQTLGKLLPSLNNLHANLQAKSLEFQSVVKSGRTHLQDAVPLTLGQEFGGYAASIARDISYVEFALAGIKKLPIGGSAVGTGLNTAPGYRDSVIEYINEITGLDFEKPDDYFAAMSGFDDVVHFTGALRALATTLKKIADDFRLMASGPRTGFNELLLPAVQPGSSIMPGKVNPVLPEMLNMAVSHVLGLDFAITHAAQGGQLELNVMMPVIAYDLLMEISILSGAISAFSEKCLGGVKANVEACRLFALKSPALATALNVKIGYAKAAEIAKEALERDCLIIDLVVEKGILTREEANELLDPGKMV